MKRQLKNEIKDELTKTNLWLNRLEKDCRDQKVFLAIRNQKIGFYHKGGLLFSFDNNSGFKTHIKYAAVFERDKSYMSEKELKQIELSLNFDNTYSRIKENCSKYTGVEALGVSEIYHKHSYLSSSDDVVVLDIEVSFQSNEFLEDGPIRKQDRIDILLFQKSTKTLKFVEAKHYSNTEIWSTKTPKVVGQIKRYENQIQINEKEIIEEYRNYVYLLNNLFQTDLPVPEKIDPKVTLLIFGFDSDQLKGRMKELIISKEDYKGIRVYRKGVISDIKTETLWKQK